MACQALATDGSAAVACAECLRAVQSLPAWPGWGSSRSCSSDG